MNKTMFYIGVFLLTTASISMAQDPTPTLPQDNGVQPGTFPAPQPAPQAYTPYAPGDGNTHVYWPGGEVHAQPGHSVSVNGGAPVVYPPVAPVVYPRPYPVCRPRAPGFFARRRMAMAYWNSHGRPGYYGWAPPVPRVRVNVN